MAKVRRTPTAGPVAASPGGSLLKVHVMPAAKGPGLAGFDPWRGALTVRVAAAAQGGAANEELCQRLAEALGLPRSRLEVSGGARAREKTVRVVGLGPDEVRRRLEAVR